MVLGDLASNLRVSPSLSIQPTVNVKLRKVTINIVDSLLLDNTTYTLSLGDALKDNREGTPFSDFTYIFSTGSYFDSLSIKGSAINAATMQIDTGMIAIMYEEATFTDSIIFKKKPLYTTKIDASGHFTFDKLPSRAFRVFVMKDIDKNQIYTSGLDEIGFIDHSILPTYNPDTVYTFHHFVEAVDSATAANIQEMLAAASVTDRKPRMGASARTPRLEADEAYRVLVDTFNAKLSSQSISEDLKILIAKGEKTIDKEKIYLSFEKDQVEIEALSQISISDSSISLHTEWQDNSIYTLRLIKGWATDSAAKEWMPGKYIFKTKGKENYGIIRVNVPATFVGNGQLLQLIKDGNTVISTLPITDSTFRYDLLLPATYTLHIIEDTDQDGAWTPGNYLLKTQAEKVSIHDSPIQLKAAWDMEITFSPAAQPRKGSKSSMRNRTQN